MSGEKKETFVARYAIIGQSYEPEFRKMLFKLTSGDSVRLKRNRKNGTVQVFKGKFLLDQFVDVDPVKAMFQAAGRLKAVVRFVDTDKLSTWYDVMIDVYAVTKEK